MPQNGKFKPSTIHLELSRCTRRLVDVVALTGRRLTLPCRWDLQLNRVRLMVLFMCECVTAPCLFHLMPWDVCMGRAHDQTHSHGNVRYAEPSCCCRPLLHAELCSPLPQCADAPLLLRVHRQRPRNGPDGIRNDRQQLPFRILPLSVRAGCVGDGRAVRLDWKRRAVCGRAVQELHGLAVRLLKNKPLCHQRHHHHGVMVVVCEQRGQHAIQIRLPGGRRHAHDNTCRFHV